MQAGEQGVEVPQSSGVMPPVGAPPGRLPVERILELARAVVAGEPVPGDAVELAPAEFARALAADLERWAEHCIPAAPNNGTPVWLQQVLASPRIRMAFQPIVDLVTGAVAGVEALARFPGEPTRPVEAWFAAADAAGLGPEFEALALRSALAALDGLPPSVFLAVNLSPEAVVSPVVQAELGDRALDGLVIEVTEHAEVADYPRLNRALRPLRRRGARLAVDDIGSGFASLRHVLRLDPDILKLHAGLTADIAGDRVRRTLGRSLVDFAGSLGAAVVAEGIETARQLEALRAVGVTHGQGFHLRRPGPLPAFAP